MAEKASWLKMAKYRSWLAAKLRSGEIQPMKHLFIISMSKTGWRRRGDNGSLHQSLISGGETEARHLSKGGRKRSMAAAGMALGGSGVAAKR